MNPYDDDIQTKKYDPHLMKRALVFLRPHAKWIALAIVLLLATSLLDILRPYLLKIIVDRHVTESNVTGLLTFGGFYLAATIGNVFSNVAYEYTTQWVGENVMSSIRTTLYSHVQRLPLAYFDRNPVGRLVTRSINDVQTMNDMLSSGLIALLGDFVVIVGIIIFMFTLHVQLTLIALTMMPLIILVSMFLRGKIRQGYRDQRQRLARINSFFQEILSGVATIQIFNREKRQFKKFDKLNDDHREALERTMVYHGLLWPLLDVLTTTSMALVLWYGGLRIVSDTLTIGVLIAFIQYIERLARPLRDLADKYNIMQAAMASAERIFELLDQPEQKPQLLEPQPTPKQPGHIEFDRVWFAYNDKDWVLRDVSFSIARGERVAIVGATGAGKTTTIGLLNRLYEISSGSIRLDQTDIAAIPYSELRQRIGVVLQDVFLFSGPVRENILLGSETISDEQMRRAAKRVNAHHFIETLPNGYDHILYERGSNLSVGQKQLLSFARALAHEPDILILDEATSSVDSETEHYIRKAIQELMQNRTSIIIAHRLSTIKHVDWILVLHKGKVAEVGTHEELLKRRGLYYRLYQLQFGKNNSEDA